MFKRLFALFNDSLFRRRKHTDFESRLHFFPFFLVQSFICVAAAFCARFAKKLEPWSPRIKVLKVQALRVRCVVARLLSHGPKGCRHNPKARLRFAVIRWLFRANVGHTKQEILALNNRGHLLSLCHLTKKNHFDESTVSIKKKNKTHSRARFYWK